MEGLSIKYIGNYCGTFLVVFVAVFACLDAVMFSFDLFLYDEHKLIGGIEGP